MSYVSTTASGTYTSELKEVQNLAQLLVELGEKSGGPGEEETQQLQKDAFGSVLDLSIKPT